ncbi:pyoverdine maturation tyrosinase PvdP [Pseudomonas sp. LRF_L74]|uniref:pyoverdine maturation tyrosinase PvdP n=1 Tax=Pseudomonas sp. LRF_L74 TaxID=3369422 RepID=UPI003F5D748C
MKFSRRGFVAGLALAVAVPAVSTGVYVQRKREEEEAAELSSDEPATPVPELADALLANRLTGIWDLRFVAGQAHFPSLALDGARLLIDVGPGGRALRGYLGRAGDDATVSVFGELSSAKEPHVVLTLQDASGERFVANAIFDEIWGEWSTGGGANTLSGQIRQAGQQPGHSTPTLAFAATRRPFVVARERLLFSPELHARLVSPGMRLFHQLWHASRDRWHKIDEERRQAVRALGWQTGPLGKERGARGKDRHENGSGEDFLFMHRHMLQQARSLQDLPSWPNLPAPRPYLANGIQAFVDYHENRTGISVPPAWEASGDDQFSQWVHYIKSSEGHHANFELWEAQYRDPEYLATLCLGELGSRIELGIHDWLHMRWASLPRDPNSGLPVVYARRPDDFAERWFEPQNDYLGDPFSSHVNPVFWRFHGWIDDRIEDWFLAHEWSHPGQVRRVEVSGVPWFAPGRWVRVAEPWLGPSEQGCGAWGRGNLTEAGEFDIETMKLALRAIFAGDEELQRLQGRFPGRPWFGRHLTPGPAHS